MTEGSPRLLIVTQNENLGDRLATALEGEGFTMTFASTGLDVISELFERPPDVVMIDSESMPAGLKIANEVLLLKPSTKLILRAVGTNLEAELLGTDIIFANAASVDELKEAAIALSRLRGSLPMVAR